jgi:hypothetical protein
MSGGTAGGAMSGSRPASKKKLFSENGLTYILREIKFLLEFCRQAVIPISKKCDTSESAQQPCLGIAPLITVSRAISFVFIIYFILLSYSREEG